MIDETQTTSSASAANGAPGVPASSPASSKDRPGTAFEAVGDSPAQHDGAKLMVTAYSIIWIVLMAWLFLMWEKSRSLHARVNELDKALDRAAAKAAAAEKPAPKAMKDAKEI